MNDLSTSPDPSLVAVPAAVSQRRRGGSLRRRLPLIISLFLIAIVGAGGAASYIEVRQTVLEAARTRLQTNARQWSQLLAPGMAQRMEEARKAAAQPALRRRLIASDPASVAAAQQQLQTLSAAPGTMSVELWDANGQRLAQALAPAGPEGPSYPAAAQVDPPSKAGVQPLRALGELIYTEHVVEVTADPDTDGQSGRGFLVFRRRAASKAAGQSVARLIGVGNALRLGSRTSDVWTDLGKRVETPPKTSGTDVVSYRRADGATWLGTETRVAGTPYSIWAETPEAVALGPAHTFWNAMLPVGALFVVLGALLAWVISRRITAPLSDLTAAAEAVAGGDLSRRVRSARSDEVGRLADAFNTMADQVQAGYTRLDTGIKARTAELEQAVSQLHDTQEQLVRREKLAMLGQLASGVGLHHLEIVDGVGHDAERIAQLVADAAPDVQEYLGILRSQIGLAEKIVGDLLDFSRIRPPRRDVIAVADIVAAQQARLTVPADVTLSVDLPPDLPRVSVDAVQIGQILFNLLINAIQSLDGRGGTIRVRRATGWR